MTVSELRKPAQILNLWTTEQIYSFNLHKSATIVIKSPGIQMQSSQSCFWFIFSLTFNLVYLKVHSRTHPDVAWSNEPRCLSYTRTSGCYVPWLLRIVPGCLGVRRKHEGYWEAYLITKQSTTDRKIWKRNRKQGQERWGKCSWLTDCASLGW